MAVNNRNVLAGRPDQAVTGAILSTTTLVTDLPSDLFNLDLTTLKMTDSGYVGDAGLTLSVKRSTNDIKDWSQAIVKKILSEFSGTLKWSHLEVSLDAMKNFFGDNNVTFEKNNATHGNRLVAKLRADELPHKSWAFRMKDGDAKIVIWVPDGQVTEADDITFAANDAIKLPVTLSCYPDKNGNSMYIATDDGVTGA